MGLRVGLCLCLVLVFAVLCDGRYTISGSENEMAMLGIGGRSLKVTLNDYNGPKANQGHDPPSRDNSGAGKKP
ncbi:hypothetical protein MANES_01G160300v8 [Manihot esculenta]|uniref:Uncharacterized protein n=1 Tax=Manihot esculenta TaxID=3983 RepID=A0A2C9WMJ0_MANES|nr:hypothetical protein MANES_01G160300v8 [Manihot esculenta]